MNFVGTKEDWKVTEDLENKTGNLSDKYDQHHSGKVPSSYGLCAKCQNCQMIRTKLNNTQIWCAEFSYRDAFRPKLILTSYDRIIECSYFLQKGSISLNEMKRIAWIIDVSQNQIGFAPTEKKVTVSLPEEE